MNPSSIPTALNLADDAMLPFALWRYAELVDGQRELHSIATRLGVTPEAVAAALRQIDEELGATAEVEPVAPVPASAASDVEVDLLIASAVDVMGPIGEVIVEDVLDELGDRTSISDLVMRVAEEIREPQRSVFLTKVRSKGLS